MHACEYGDGGEEAVITIIQQDYERNYFTCKLFSCFPVLSKIS